MKSYHIKIILVLITFGILFVFMPIITTNLCFITVNINKNSDYRDGSNLNNDNLKASKVSVPIYIDDNDPNNNWSVSKDAGICTGNGTYSEPYIIEDLVIDSGGSTCIRIENSDVYFKIENCTLYNTDDAGIKLEYVNNGQLTDNNCSSNYYGISLSNSNNISISGNTVTNNNITGIHLYSSNNNTISGNIANNNCHGIYLYSSNNNIISGNTATNNKYHGMYLHSSNNNTISGNTATNNNSIGIHLDLSEYNIVSGNTPNNNKVGIALDTSCYNIVSRNTANNSNYYGIFLGNSYFNTISGNTANKNHYGVYLFSSENNIISGNILLGNDECIVEENCEGNIFENNDCGEAGGFPFELIILISSISVGAVIGILSLLFIRRKRLIRV